jgi:hypothetical protein
MHGDREIRTTELVTLQGTERIDYRWLDGPPRAGRGVDHLLGAGAGLDRDDLPGKLLDGARAVGAAPSVGGPSGQVVKVSSSGIGQSPAPRQ